jgi:hypothetical protein
MLLGALWQKTLASALATPCQGCTATLCFHAGAEAMLAFSRAL